jgi:hypothetical protein
LLIYTYAEAGSNGPAWFRPSSVNTALVWAIAMGNNTGNAALATESVRKNVRGQQWRCHRTPTTVSELTSCHVLTIAGGNAGEMTIELPLRANIVAATTGPIAAIGHCNADLDALFCDGKTAQEENA